MTSATGAQAIFARNEKGELESPKGDGNLKLTAAEEAGKTVYYLSDAASSAKTKFELPVVVGAATPTYSSQFGSEGAGNGQFSHPGDVAVDSKGNLWVLDHGNDRVEEFNAKSEYLQVFGSKGSGNGQLSGPDGLAVDSKGDVWVVDTGNSRVEEFNEKGEYQKVFGSSGSGSGQFKTPEGIAVDAHGDVWVSDTGNGRLQEFNEKSEYVKTVGSKGSGAGQIGEPEGVAIDSHGNLWVADWSNDRVEEFNETGEYVREFGSVGSENGQLTHPYGIAVDSSGSVWVGDSGNNRVDRFNEKGEYVSQFGSKGSGAGQFSFSFPIGVAVDSKGDIWVTDSNNDRVEKWTLPAPPEQAWLPALTEGPVAHASDTYTFQTVQVEGKWVTEPTQELAPVPSGVSCSPEFKNGCRALIFTYAAETTAKGEGPSEWGEYKGRLIMVSLKAYVPGESKPKTTAVAQYSYDKQGRLRAEWNPQVSPALKTVYGYDAEGHVAAVSSPGQEPWLLHYGATASDPSSGRLLSATRPAASTSTELKEQKEESAPANTEAPTLSNTSPTIGTTLSASSNGKWSNLPLAYSYSWEDCYTYESKETCTAIPGAVNSTYTPQAHDAGYMLKALVTAVNADGTGVAPTAASKALGLTAPAYLRKFGEKGESEKGQFNAPVATAVDATGNVWVVDHNNDRVEKWSSTGTWQHTYGKKGSGELQFENPEGIAINTNLTSPSFGDVYIADRGNNRIEELNSEGKYVRAFGKYGKAPGELNSPLGVAVNAYGDVWVGDYANDRIDEFSEVGAYLGSFGAEGSGNGQFTGPDGIAFVGEDAYVVDSGGNRVEEFSLSGQYVAQFGSKGSGEGQFSTPYGIATEPVSGDLYVDDYGNNRVEEFNPAGAFVVAFGKKGEGNGEFMGPESIAVNSLGDVYVPDSGNNRVQEFEPKYSTNNPTPEPPALGTSAVSTIDYNVPLSGSGLQTMTKGEVEKWGQKDDPTEATAIFPPDEPMGWPAKDYKRATVSYYDEQGRLVNVATPSGAVSTSEYNPYNDVVRTLSPDNRAAALKEGSKSAEASKLLDTESAYNETGSEPGTELLSTLGPQHTIELTSGAQAEARAHTVYSYDEGAPSKGGPYRLVTKLTQGAQIAGKEESEIRTTTTSYTGPGNQENLGWKLRKPTAVTTDPNGLKLVHTTVYDPTTGNATETRTPASTSHPTKESTAPPKYNLKFEVYQSPAGIAIDSAGNVWVSRYSNEKKIVSEYGSEGKFLKGFGEFGGFPEEFGLARGMAINKGTGEVYVDNYIDGEESGAENIHVFSAEGKYLRSIGTKPTGVAVDSGGNVWEVDNYTSVREYSSTGELMASFGAKGKEKEKIQFEGAEGILVWNGKVFVTDSVNDRVTEFSTSGAYIAEFGKEGKGEGQFSEPSGIAIDAATEILYVADTGNNRVQEFSTTGEYLTKFGSEGSGEGQLKKPRGIAINSSDGVYVVDAGNQRVEEWTAPQPKSSAHDTQTIYYSAAANETYKACGEHPEWAELPCQTQPAAQPETGQQLPVTTYTYNMWDEPEKTTETVGSTTRTKTATYDEAGRPKTTTTSSTVGTALPTVAEEYNTETGALEKQSTTTEGKTKTITNTYNTLAQLIAYTDADESTSTYEYDVDGRIHKTNDGKGTQTDIYNTTTGTLTELFDSSVKSMIFTATYDVEGNMLTESYPNGMSANYTYNPSGTATALEYKKTTHCTEKCTWFSDTVVPSIHDQWLSQTSTFSSQAYTYDAAGRLIQVQNTPVGKGCTTRVYAYDEDTNRTSLTTREPNSKGECTTTGGTVEKHSYDEADRLTDTGTSYNTFGNITALPASDAGGSELTSTYYTDNQLATQTQNGETIGYNLDPAGRTRETVSTGKSTSDVISHYAGPGNSPAWTTNTSGEWTRNIPGIGGTLAAIQNNGETPVLQLTNLHGDIIATAYKSETATELASKADTTEFGVPSVSAPPKYSWLGAIELPTELPSGIIAMGARSYVPQLGRFLQPDPVPGGSANAYAYTYGDPVNTTDPTGTSSNQLAAFFEFNNHVAHQATIEAEEAARRAAEEAAARAAAELAAREARIAAAFAGTSQYSFGGGGQEEYREEGEEYEEEEEGGYTGGDPIAVAAAPCRHEDNPGASRCSTNGYAVVTKTSKGPLCQVHFDGITSSCQSVLERAKRQYEADNRTAKEWMDIIKCAVKRGMCPDG